MAFGRVCHLVSSLHQANIAHCDLKLDNLLINNDDVSSIVLCDFSECCSIPISSDTLLSHSRGTECYASPELHKSTPTRPYSVDCWCLGCLFYELVTGRILFPGKGDCLLPSLASEDWPAHGSGVASIFESHFKSNQAASMALSLLQSILKKEETRLDSIEIARRVDRIISHS